MMKNFLTSGLVFLVLVSASCNNNKEPSVEKKDSKVEKQTDSTNVPAENLISFKVNKQLVVSPIFNILRFDFGTGQGTSLNLSISNSADQPKIINFNINGDKPGHYPLKSLSKTTKTKGSAYGNYSPNYRQTSVDYNKPSIEQFSFVNGEFVITSIDTTAGVMNATFYGTAKNTKGDSVLITDGNVINGKLNPGITKFK